MSEEIEEEIYIYIEVHQITKHENLMQHLILNTATKPGTQ